MAIAKLSRALNIREGVYSRAEPTGRAEPYASGGALVGIDFCSSPTHRGPYVGRKRGRADAYVSKSYY